MADVVRKLSSFDARTQDILHQKLVEADASRQVLLDHLMAKAEQIFQEMSTLEEAMTCPHRNIRIKDGLMSQDVSCADCGAFIESDF